MPPFPALGNAAMALLVRSVVQVHQSGEATAEQAILNAAVNARYEGHIQGEDACPPAAILAEMQKAPSKFHWSVRGGLPRLERASPYDQAVSSAVPSLVGTLIGGGIALVSGFGLEMIRSWQQRRASWREMQANTIAELQELLCEIKDELARGKPPTDGARAVQAPTEWDLEKYAPRTRARMLCSRLADGELGGKISGFLADLKDEDARWRTSPAEWLKDQNQFASYASTLGMRMQTHKPWWVKS